MALFLIGLSVTIGMWLERYMLLVSSLYRDYLVSSWGDYHASFWDWSLFAGMLGVFLTPFLLFVRFLPVISVFEIREAAFEEGKEPAMREPTRRGGLRAARRIRRSRAAGRGRKKARDAGFRNMDAYSPFPIDGLAEALGFADRRVPLLTLAGGIFGAALGYRDAGLHQSRLSPSTSAAGRSSPRRLSCWSPSS